MAIHTIIDSINGEYIAKNEILTDEEIANINDDAKDVGKTPEERIADLETQNQMLIDCILEMSEMLYE